MNDFISNGVPQQLKRQDTHEIVMTSDVLGSNLLEASASVTSDVVESGSSNAAEIKADTPDSLSPTTISFIDNIFWLGPDSMSRIARRGMRPCARENPLLLYEAESTWEEGSTMSVPAILDLIFVLAS